LGSDGATVVQNMQPNSRTAVDDYAGYCLDLNQFMRGLFVMHTRHNGTGLFGEASGTGSGVQIIEYGRIYDDNPLDRCRTGGGGGRIHRMGDERLGERLFPWRKIVTYAQSAGTRSL